MRREQLTDALVQWIHDEGVRGTIPEKRMSDHVVIGRFTPQMLAILGCNDRELVTSVSHLEKMMFDHAISAARLKNLHGIICTPEKIFRSASQPATSIVVMTIETLRYMPIIVPIHLDKPGATGKAPDHWVASAYAKDQPAMLAKWEARGLLMWQQK